MFYDKFLEYYQGKLKEIDEKYAAKTKALESAMEETHQAELADAAAKFAGLTKESAEKLDAKLKDVQAQADARAEKEKADYDANVAKLAQRYEDYCKGVATRGEFKELQQQIGATFQQEHAEQDKRLTAVEEGYSRKGRELDKKVAAQDNKITEINKTLEASDNRKLAHRVNDLEGRMSAVIPLIIAIIAFLLAAAMAVLMVLDINPFHKEEEQEPQVITQVVEEEKTVCAEHHLEEIRWVAPSYDENGNTVLGKRISICTVCGYVDVEEFDHAHLNDTEGTVVTAPTLTETGSRSYKCDYCDVPITEEIPALLADEYRLPADSTNPCKEAMTGLEAHTAALNPDVINHSLSEEYPFNAENMLWFVTDSGDYILVIRTGDEEGAMDAELAKLDNLANVKGEYVHNTSMIYVRLDSGEELISGLKEACSIITNQIDVMSTLANVMGEPVQVGNAIPVVEESTEETTEDTTGDAAETEGDAASADANA